MEIHPLVWWVHIWEFWFHPPCLCQMQERWVWGALLVTMVTYSKSKALLSSMATCHPIWFALSGTIICFLTGQWPQTHLQAMEGLFEREWWSATSDDLASTMTWPKPNWDGLGWVGPASAQHLLQDCWKIIPDDYLMKLIERMPRVCKAVINVKHILFLGVFCFTV